MLLLSSHCLVLLLPTMTFFSFPKEVAAFQIITFGNAEDTTIKSENFPGRYPAGDNVTWSWSVTSGYWGVVFLDFDLDPGLDGYGDYDQLELSDGVRTPTYHSLRNPPVVPYKTQGSQLLVRFITDTRTGRKDFRGFQLRILYGNSEPDLNRKISVAEVEKEKNRQISQSSEDESRPVPVTTVVTLIVVFAVIVLVAVIAFRRSTFRKRLRRQSTVSVRTGRAEMLAGMTRVPTTPTTPSMPRSPGSRTAPLSPTLSATSGRTESGSRRPNHPVQRSVSQQDWSARFSLESQERSAQPNDYARSEPTHQTNIKCTISHEVGAGGISVSSTITSSSVPESRAQHEQTSLDFVPPRRLRKSQSEKVMTSVGAAARGDGALRSKVSCSLSKLETISDDSQEFDGAGDFVDTIDHLDPLPLEAIRGKNLLPINLKTSPPPPQEQAGRFDPQPEANFNLSSTSPPPYFPQTSLDSCYENVSPNQAQLGPQRKSSIYANQIPSESGEEHENSFSLEEFQPVNQGGAGSVSPPRNQLGSPTASDLIGDYALLKQPHDDATGKDKPPKKEHDVSIDMEEVFGDALNKVVPVASKPKAIGRTHRLGSAYDIPPKSDDPYDIPPPSYKETKGDGPYNLQPATDKQRSGDDPYDIPPSSYKQAKGDGPYNMQPATDKLRSGDDPYDIPPSSYTQAKGGAPFVKSPAVDNQRSGDDPYDIPPTSDKQAKSDDDYDIPPSSDNSPRGGGKPSTSNISKYNGPYESTPARDLSYVSPRMNLDYVPTSMARTQAKGDNPYDIPPSGRRI